MIKIKDLRFQYAGSDSFALDGVSLEIPRGKYVAILGHNGSGKSTFSKLIVGLYKPTFGSIEIDGIKMEKKNLNDIRKKVGIVFQNPENQFIGATVEDDIAFGLENISKSREEMQKIIQENSKKVNMHEFLTHEPSKLSGGQKQRVAIASILSLDPEVIIFDEVTSMLDPIGKEEVLKIIKDIQTKKDKTLISITHDMDEAIMADVVYVFSGGKLAAHGNPAEILNDKKICDLAKIDAPFIHKLSDELSGIGVKPTYDRDELVKQIASKKKSSGKKVG